MRHRLAACFGFALLLARGVYADEGMWPLDMLPRDQIKQRHGVALTDAFVEHVKLSSVRFSSGGSGAFVSGKGLVLTNHHVAADCIAKISNATHDYMGEGYLAGKDGGEVACPDLELDVLQSTEDATDRVQSARTPSMTDAVANLAIKSEMTREEQACQHKTHLRCEMVTLYAGGKYHLYIYKRFTDVRLVFAPEAKLAFFGGDPDNFTFPRYDLDMALFRVYEGGKSVSPEHFLTWSASGPSEGDTVFVSGHPGSTGRMQTTSQLTTTREVTYRYALRNLKREADLLHAYGRQGHEHERQARESLFGVENAVKALSGYQNGLNDPDLMKLKNADEARLVLAIKGDPALSSRYGTTFEQIAKVQAQAAAMYPVYAALERGSNSSLLGFARHLVRMPSELADPSDQRLREYRDSNLDSLKRGLFSPAPLYAGVELAAVQAWMENAKLVFAGKPALLAQIFHGLSPELAARQLVAGSRLFDVYARKRLFEGEKLAIDASTDPAVVLMRTLDPQARAIRKSYEDQVEAPMRALGPAVAKATFAVKGPAQAPDATFTLRLSVGVVKGYREHGVDVPAMTDWAGMFGHATGKEPFALPARILAARSKLAPTTPYNFVSTNDIIGGNSGSPVISVDGKIVGLIFDGNLSSLPNRFVYREVTERAVSVDTAAMTEALAKVYDAGAVVAELLGR